MNAATRLACLFCLVGCAKGAPTPSEPAPAKAPPSPAAAASASAAPASANAQDAGARETRSSAPRCVVAGGRCVGPAAIRANPTAPCPPGFDRVDRVEAPGDTPPCLGMRLGEEACCMPRH